MSSLSRHAVTILSLIVLLVVFCALLAMLALYARARTELTLAQREPFEIISTAPPDDTDQHYFVDDLSNALLRASAERDAVLSDLHGLRALFDAISNALLTTQNDLEAVRSRLASAEAVHTVVTTSVAVATASTVTQTRTVSILGIPMQQRKLAFLLDNSGSMADEGRLAEVRGAMKVVLASLDENHQIDLMTFCTAADKTPVLTALWGGLTAFTPPRREQAISFLMNLAPSNGTPTVAAVSNAFALYPDAEALVLISDGEPTDFDPYGVQWERAVTAIERSNTRRVPIYTIGVGPRMRNPRHAGRRFMERLSLTSRAASTSF